MCNFIIDYVLSVMRWNATRCVQWVASKAQHSNTLNPFKSIWIHSQPTRISRVFWHGWSCISFAFVRSSEYFHMIHIWYLWILFIFVYICLDLVQVNKILISITRINLLHVNKLHVMLHDFPCCLDSAGLPLVHAEVLASVRNAAAGELRGGQHLTNT